MRDNDCRQCARPLDLSKPVFRASGGGLVCSTCQHLIDAQEAELRRLEVLSMAYDLASGDHRTVPLVGLKSPRHP